MSWVIDDIAGRETSALEGYIPIYGNYRDAIRHYALGEEGFCSWDGHLSMGLTIVDVITLGNGKQGKGGTSEARAGAKVDSIGGPSKSNFGAPRQNVMQGAEARSRPPRRGSGKNEPHGRPPPTQLEEQVQNLEGELRELNRTQGSAKEKAKIRQKIININSVIDKIIKGETHHMR
jgi:hypothetical protein